MSESLVVVGASVATTAFIERLRELGNSSQVRVIDCDPDAPYDRPPLSKHYLVEGEAEDIAVDWSDLDAELVRARATSVDTSASVVRVEYPDGRVGAVPFDQLVIATGASAARLPIEPEDTTVLRSAADARRLRERTANGESAVVIGAGAIGVELASSLAARGSKVALLDRAAGPLERLLAGHLGRETSTWLADAGVVCHWEADIARISATDSGWEVELRDGPVLVGDVLISAVGARPAVSWLEDSGLLTQGALMVDADGRVLQAGTVVPHLFGIGDAVTRMRDDGPGTRTESWAEARQQGASLAELLTGASRQPAPPSYFWTEVAGRKVQVVGSLHPDAVPVLEFENPDRGATLHRYDAPDGTSAWIGVNAQPRIARLLTAA